LGLKDGERELAGARGRFLNRDRFYDFKNIFTKNLAVFAEIKSFYKKIIKTLFLKVIFPPKLCENRRKLFTSSTPSFRANGKKLMPNACGRGKVYG
jgi:hypothetical protein